MKGIDATKVTNALNLIEASAVLHNFIIKYNDDDFGFEDDIGGCNSSDSTSADTVFGAAATVRKSTEHITLHREHLNICFFQLIIINIKIVQFNITHSISLFLVLLKCKTVDLVISQTIVYYRFKGMLYLEL